MIVSTVRYNINRDSGVNGLMSSENLLTIELNAPLSKAINHVSMTMGLSPTAVIEDAVQAYIKGDIADKMNDTKILDEFLKLYDIYVENRQKN